MDLFSQSLVIPQNLRFYLHRLTDNAQPSTNILRVNALNSTSASSGGLVIVRLPMALVDLNSFAWHFETQLTDGYINNPTEGGDNVLRGILPKGCEGLISRLEVSVNGLGLLNLQQYNLLFSLLKDSHMHLDKALSRSQLQNERDMVPLYVRDGGAITSGTNEVIPIHVSNWVANASGTTATITCRTTDLEAIPITGGAYELLYAPPPQYFGLAFTGTQTAQPAISAIRNIQAYNTTKGVSGGATVVEFDLVYTGATFTTATALVSSSPANAQFSIFSTASGQTTGTPNLRPAENNFHTISEWLGFFKAQPDWVQTQMLGEVEVRITLAQNDVLGITHPQVPYTSAVQASGWKPSSLPDFSLNNIFFSIRTCSFDNNFVDDMLHSKLSGGGELEIPYPNYFNINQIQSGGSSQTRFSVNTQSLDKVVSCNRVAGFNQYYNNLCAVPCGLGPTTQNKVAMVHRNPYFCTTASVPSGYTYGQSAYSDPASFNYWQYQINNAFVPNYKISPVNNFFFNQEMYDHHNDWNSGTCSTVPTIYLNSNYQMGVALDFMDDEIPRLVSGVDTRGAVSVAYLNQDANLSGDRTDIFTCFTSILRIGANQQVQVVY